MVYHTHHIASSCYPRGNGFGERSLNAERRFRVKKKKKPGFLFLFVLFFFFVSRSAKAKSLQSHRPVSIVSAWTIRRSHLGALYIKMTIYALYSQNKHLFQAQLTCCRRKLQQLTAGAVENRLKTIAYEHSAGRVREAANVLLITDASHAIKHLTRDPNFHETLASLCCTCSWACTVTEVYSTVLVQGASIYFWSPQRSRLICSWLTSHRMDVTQVG